MQLTASLIVRNELGRYLIPCVEHLRTFCDRIVIVDDASDDGTSEWLEEHEDDQLAVIVQPASRFYQHEGQARQRLLDYTLDTHPTHVLNLDADEFLADGPELRRLVEAQPDVAAWHIPIEEVWMANGDHYLHRTDGGWSMGRTLCWKVPDRKLSFPNRRLACGRVPMQIRTFRATPAGPGVSLLHVGWLDPSQREPRHARYVRHDGGRFHASAHLDSILWPPERISLHMRPWPPALLPWRDAILEHGTVSA